MTQASPILSSSDVPLRLRPSPVDPGIFLPSSPVPQVATRSRVRVRPSGGGKRCLARSLPLLASWVGGQVHMATSHALLRLPLQNRRGSVRRGRDVAKPRPQSPESPRALTTGAGDTTPPGGGTAAVGGGGGGSGGGAARGLHRGIKLWHRSS